MRVHPDYQRRGLGQLIYGELEKRAHKKGFQKLVLDTTVPQKAAQSFYLKNGFAETHRVTPNSSLDLEMIYYEKFLKKMDWIQFDQEIQALSGKINSQFDVIVGIVRGGLIPARLLSKYLGVKELYCLTVQKQGNERKVVTEITARLQNKKVLLVEDILETGKSLMVAKKYLETKGANVSTAALCVMPISEIEPNFYLKKVEKLVPFPWD